MATYRRKAYLPIGNNPKYAPYHKAYDRYRRASNILEIGQNSKPNINTMLWDKGNAESAKIELIGTSNGLYKNKDSEKDEIAKIPFVKEQIKDVEDSFKRLNQNRWNNGYETLKEMPENLFNKKLRLEAEHDVYLEELEKLEDYLKRYKAREQKVEDDRVLQYGIQCHMRFHGTKAADPELMNVVNWVDGQNVGQIDGLLVILDKRSPYNGMSLIDYRKMYKIEYDRKHAIYLKLYEQQQKDIQEKGFSNVKVPRLGWYKVSRSSLPPFPDWAVNHLKKEASSNEKKHTMRRKSLKTTGKK